MTRIDGLRRFKQTVELLKIETGVAGETACRRRVSEDLVNGFSIFFANETNPRRFWRAGDGRMKRDLVRGEMMRQACFVSTLDNPFDYFTQFDEWYNFDTTHGYERMGKPYNTCAYVARIAKTSVDLSEEDYRAAIEDAVDDIVRLNLTGNYVKVWEKEQNKGNNNDKISENRG